MIFMNTCNLPISITTTTLLMNPDVTKKLHLIEKTNSNVSMKMFTAILSIELLGKGDWFQ